jgi:hypothetical protein
MTRIGPGEVRERYGIDPEQVPDFIAWREDPAEGWAAVSLDGGGAELGIAAVGGVAAVSLFC